MKFISTLAFLVFALTTPTFAQSSAPVAVPDPVEWQTAITGQLEAFRAGDGPAALVFAGNGFKAAFPDPSKFYGAILSSGYEPLLTSRSHSFGEFQVVSEDAVLQLVKVIGPNQLLYNAFYQMVREEGDCHVAGVQLNQTEGIGV